MSTGVTHPLSEQGDIHMPRASGALEGAYAGTQLSLAPSAAQYAGPVTPTQPRPLPSLDDICRAQGSFKVCEPVGASVACYCATNKSTRPGGVTWSGGSRPSTGPITPPDYAGPKGSLEYAQAKCQSQPAKA